MGQKKLPSFIEFSPIDNVYVFAPQKNHIGTYRIKIDIIDSYGNSNTYQFMIKINKPAQVEDQKKKGFSWATYKIKQVSNMGILTLFVSANLGSASGIIAKITNETFDIKLQQDGLESKVRYTLVPNIYGNSKNIAKLQL